MAQINNTVDPNDLDSIDALLDEAEQESIAEEPEVTQVEAATPEPAGGVDDVPEEWADTEASEDSTEDLLSELGENVESSGIEAEETAAPEPTPSPAEESKGEPSEPDVGLGMMQQPDASQKAMEDKAEDILEKRAQAQKANNAIKGSDMDAIKKLIVIFSSVIITLVIAAIGIGIWGALSSGPGLSKETLDKIDGIESNSTQSLMHTNTSEKTLQTLDKKLDALSFQLEQLNSDIAKIETNGAKKIVAEQSSDKTQPPVVKPSDKAKTISEAAPELTAKLNRIGTQMTSAQRRIYEVNKRVKRLQSVYYQLLKSIKNVEKQLIEEKVEKPSVKTEKGSASSNLTVPGHVTQGHSNSKEAQPGTPHEVPYGSMGGAYSY
ncbi:hypothetical protein [Hydrogenovibrio kuenenii]|uniref:hypothetical protein n=1 Tax=Hydrogenovibrio kuenenii TaxID=63658 RepID=UPI0004633871|nr:hypothetical protein [Hydrogenovibrio kuenenii]